MGLTKPTEYHFGYPITIPFFKDFASVAPSLHPLVFQSGYAFGPMVWKEKCPLLFQIIHFKQNVINFVHRNECNSGAITRNDLQNKKRLHKMLF